MAEGTQPVLNKGDASSNIFDPAGDAFARVVGNRLKTKSFDDPPRRFLNTASSILRLVEYRLAGFMYL